jgi:hypothetical protein
MIDCIQGFMISSRMRNRRHFMGRSNNKPDPLHRKTGLGHDPMLHLKARSGHRLSQPVPVARTSPEIKPRKYSELIRYNLIPPDIVRKPGRPTPYRPSLGVTSGAPVPVTRDQVRPASFSLTFAGIVRRGLLWLRDFFFGKSS